jgi:hypothetical protein
MPSRFFTDERHHTFTGWVLIVSSLLGLFSLSLPSCSPSWTWAKANSATPPTGPTLLWPCYDPAVFPATLAIANTGKPMIVIVNVDSGPGATTDIEWLNFIHSLQGRNTVRILGYIDLVTWDKSGKHWSPKNTRDLITEHQRWKDWYHVPETWLDDCFSEQPAIRNLVQSAAFDPKTTFLNPGDTLLQTDNWMLACGTICDHEKPGQPSPLSKHQTCIIFTTAGNYERDRAQLLARSPAFLVAGFAVKDGHEFQTPPPWWRSLAQP